MQIFLMANLIRNIYFCELVARVIKYLGKKSCIYKQGGIEAYQKPR